MEIGRLAWHPARKTSYFIFNPEFLGRKLDIAPLTASVYSPASSRAIFAEPERIYQNLPPFIADSLPDAWGNQLFEQWRKDKHLSDRDITPLDKLAFIGKRGMGALEFEPETDLGLINEKINVKALADLAEKILTERENISILPEESLTLQSLIRVGTSAGGRQPKGIIAMNPKTGEIRSGQVEADREFEYFILKFGDAQRSTAELELTYYLMARKAGINMMESRLLKVDGVNHFLTRRFDRDNSGKLHIQTLAAMCPGADSYEKLTAVCRKLQLPETDIQELFRRMVFNFLANNTDDHNKNFSFVMDRKGKWSLAPAYDMTFIFNTGGFQPNKEHCLMTGGKLQDVSLDDIRSFASEQGIHRPEAVIHEVADAIGDFRTLARQNGVGEEWTGRIEAVLNHNLEEWGLRPPASVLSFVAPEGHKVEKARIESAFKGNYHLVALVDGKESRYVIRKQTPLHDEISALGLSRLSPERLQSLVCQFLLQNS